MHIRKPKRSCVSWSPKENCTAILPWENEAASVWIRPADPREYLRPELAAVFRKLEPMGFTEAQLRGGALELLHDEEWSPSRELPPPVPEVQPPQQLGMETPEGTAGQPETMEREPAPPILSSEDISG